MAEYFIVEEEWRPKNMSRKQIINECKDLLQKYNDIAKGEKINKIPLYVEDKELQYNR
jgi:hypothetical protein